MPRTSTSAYRLDDQIGFLLRRAYQRASANLAARLTGFDLTPPQFSTLARLHEHGALSQNRLGRLVAMEPANISDVVRRLKRRRLVMTGRDPRDGRLMLVTLTDAGAALFRNVLPIQIAATARTLAKLRPRERQTLAALLRRLGNAD